MKVFILYVFELPWKWNSARFQISRWLLSQSIEHVSALIQKNIRQSFLCAVAFCSPGIVVVGLCQWLFRLRIWLHVLPEQAQVNAPSFLFRDHSEGLWGSCRDDSRSSSRQDGYLFSWSCGRARGLLSSSRWVVCRWWELRREKRSLLL